MENSRIQKIKFEWKPKGKKHEGGQYKQWKEQTEEEVKS